MSKVDLRVDWCSHEAAKYAVEHWHYSKSLPSFKKATFGVWENSIFIGTIIYSWGANRNIGSPYGLETGQAVELVRVALSHHYSPVSEIVSKTIKMIRIQSPGIRCLVSYADPLENHMGGIYQAMNWVYIGLSSSSEKVWYNGKWSHKRTVDSKYGNHKGFEVKNVLGKHKYLYPLDRAMRKQIAVLAKPYPKRESCGQSVEGDTIDDQSIE